MHSTKIVSALSVTMLAGIAVAVPADPAAGSPADTLPTYVDIISNLTLADDGIVHLADDGVARSYAGNGSVIDAVAISNTAIMGHITDPSLYNEIEIAHLKEVFHGISGHNVTNRTTFHEPPTHLRPANFPSNDKREFGELQAEYEKRVEVREELKGRQLFCMGQKCTSTGACVIFGFRICTGADALLSSKKCVGVANQGHIRLASNTS